MSSPLEQAYGRHVGENHTKLNLKNIKCKYIKEKSEIENQLCI